MNYKFTSIVTVVQLSLSFVDVLFINELHFTHAVSLTNRLSLSAEILFTISIEAMPTETEQLFASWIFAHMKAMLGFVGKYYPHPNCYLHSRRVELIRFQKLFKLFPSKINKFFISNFRFSQA